MIYQTGHMSLLDRFGLSRNPTPPKAAIAPAPVPITIFVVLALVGVCCSGNRPIVTEELYLESDATDVALPVPTDEPALENGTDEAAPATSAVSETQSPGPSTDDQTAATDDLGPQSLKIDIIETFNHDPESFTQGLLVDGETLLESAGQFGQSNLRRVDTETGDVIQQVATPDDLFAEGLTRVDELLYQLTWRAGRAFVWDVESFELISEFSYDGQGWGICNDGQRLIMSDGSSSLFFRDLHTFELTGSVSVTIHGAGLDQLNELECVDGSVWANVWQTDLIVRIDPATGVVTGTVDASKILRPRPATANVLNGIAYDEASDTFLITGKYWPELFRVRFSPADPS